MQTLSPDSPRCISIFPITFLRILAARFPFYLVVFLESNHVYEELKEKIPSKWQVVRFFKQSLSLLLIFLIVEDNM